MKVTSEVFDLLNSGLIYIQGRDKNFRPIMVMKAKQFVDNFHQIDNLMAAMVVTIEYIKYFMSSPGHVENIVIIIDLTGVGISHGQQIKTLSQKFKDTIGANYKGVIRALYLLNSPRAFSLIWNSIKYFFDENSVRKISIVSYNTCPVLLDLVSANQIEEKYGGSATDRECGNFWPPCLPDNNFGAVN